MQFTCYIKLNAINKIKYLQNKKRERLNSTLRSDATSLALSTTNSARLPCFHGGTAAHT